MKNTDKLIAAYTAAGFRNHWTRDGRVTLCGLDVTGMMSDQHIADCRNCMVKTGERHKASRL
jgi:hypothetical protein